MVDLDYLLSVPVCITTDSVAPYKVFNRGVIDVSFEAEGRHSGGGSGFCVQLSGHRWVMTNHHVIRNRSDVYVRRNGQDREFRAQVFEGSHELDLAVLTVDDEAFWKDAVYPEIETDLPKLCQEVFLVGFPGAPWHKSGTRRVNIDRGTVSTIGVRSGVFRIHSDTRGNGGNSGGPLLNAQGHLVGVHCASRAILNNDQNIRISVSVPGFVVNSFLLNVSESGSFEGVFGLRVLKNRLRFPNSGLAAYEFFGRVPQGVHYKKSQHDLLTHINSIPINTLGFVNLPDTHFWLPLHIFALWFPEPINRLDYRGFPPQRDYSAIASPKILELPSANFSEAWNPRTKYVLLGGYVFFEFNNLTPIGLRLKTDHWSWASHQFKKEIGKPPTIIVYQSVPHESTEGNMWPGFSFVSHCNDIKIDELEELVNMAEVDVNPFLIIECRFGKEFRTICVDKRTITQDAQVIQQSLGIRSNIWFGMPSYTVLAGRLFIDVNYALSRDLNKDLQFKEDHADCLRRLLENFRAGNRRQGVLIYLLYPQPGMLPFNLVRTCNNKRLRNLEDLVIMAREKVIEERQLTVTWDNANDVREWTSAMDLVKCRINESHYTLQMALGLPWYFRLCGHDVGSDDLQSRYLFIDVNRALSEGLNKDLNKDLKFGKDDADFLENLLEVLMTKNIREGVLVYESAPRGEWLPFTLVASCDHKPLNGIMDLAYMCSERIGEQPLLRIECYHRDESRILEVEKRTLKIPRVFSLL